MNRPASLDLTKTQAIALAAFDGFTRKNGVTPTLEALGNVLGVTKTAAKKTIHALVDKRCLAVGPGRYRPWTLTLRGVRLARAQAKESN